MTAHISNPPEPRAALYQVIHTSPMTLAVGQDLDITFEFFLGDRVFTSDPIIVSFLLEHAEDLQLNVSINNVSFDWSYQPGPERVVQHVLRDAGKEGVNQLTLTVHRGRLRFSYLVIWYLVAPWLLLERRALHENRGYPEFRGRGGRRGSRASHVVDNWSS
jgi:hypothetical protein